MAVHDGLLDTYSYLPYSHQLLGIAGADPKTFTYDGTGNATADGIRTFSYDVRNRLTQVDGSGQPLGVYVHNGLGQRVEKATPGSPADSRRFAYDEAGRLIGEYDLIGNTIHEIVYLADHPVAVIGSGGAIRAIHADHLGTPRAIADAQGVLIWRWQSDAFGVGAPDEDPDGDGIQFRYDLRLPGQYHDAESGLHQNWNRDYSPDLGRYVESDPIGLVGGLNTYAYSSSNPVGRTDRMGLLDEGGSGGDGGGGPFSPIRCYLVWGIPLGYSWPSWLPSPVFKMFCIYDCSMRCPRSYEDYVAKIIPVYNPPYVCPPTIDMRTGRW